MRKLLKGLFLLIAVLFVFSACNKDDDFQPDPAETTCTDGIQNGNETGIDCGGDCSPCQVVPTCDDGILNGDETDVDCGGSCTPCEVVATCTDGIQNGNETGVDCGGSCAPCETAATCSDGIQNGDETGVDCGGSCTACNDIVSMKAFIESTPRFSLLKEAITRAEFDLHTLPGNFTLFAPNNEAWEAFLENNNWSSVQDISPAVLNIILEVQFSDMGKFTSDLFVDNYQIQIVYQDRKIHVNLSNPDVLEMVAGLSKAVVIDSDFEMTNGIIHETNGILVF